MAGLEQRERNGTRSAPGRGCIGIRIGGGKGLAEQTWELMGRGGVKTCANERCSRAFHHAGTWAWWCGWVGGAGLAPLPQERFLIIVGPVTDSCHQPPHCRCRRSAPAGAQLPQLRHATAACRPRRRRRHRVAAGRQPQHPQQPEWQPPTAQPAVQPAAAGLPPLHGGQWGARSRPPSGQQGFGSKLPGRRGLGRWEQLAQAQAQHPLHTGSAA